MRLYIRWVGGCGSCLMGRVQVVLDTACKACWEKFSLKFIFIWLSNGKHLNVQKVIWKYDSQEVPSLSMLKEILNDIHIKSFAGQVTAVDVFYSIHKAAIFNAEQLILESKLCSTLNLYCWTGNFFPFLTQLNLILTCQVVREDNARFYHLGPNGPDDKNCIYLAPAKDYITSIRSELNYETQKSYLWNSYIEFSESFY